MLDILAIDGPSGVGKSSTARRVAAELGWAYMDTGAMYRAATLALMRAGAAPGEAGVLGSLGFEQLGGRFFLKGEDVSEEIRSREVTQKVSAVSADPSVREALVDVQRRMGRGGRWVVDGRDIGTVVFPQAVCKIFLVADPEARAHRRLLELRSKGIGATFQEVLEDQARRDYLDSTREAGPLSKAEDAIELDSGGLSLEEVVERILGIYRSRVAQTRP